MKEKWKTYWKASLQEKGKWFGDIQTDIQNSWFDKSHLQSREFYTTICRLRMGHCSFKQHLFRLQMVGWFAPVPRRFDYVTRTRLPPKGLAKQRPSSSHVDC
ncbi:hypothetical protein ACJJTC_000356 [Scirpophaga incertulas]